MAKLKQLYIDSELNVGKVVQTPKELSRRLSRVLRQKKGDHIALFNGTDGLFEAQIQDDGCKELSIESILQAQPPAQNVALITCLVKKDAMDKIYTISVRDRRQIESQFPRKSCFGIKSTW